MQIKSFLKQNICIPDFKMIVLSSTRVDFSHHLLTSYFKQHNLFSSSDHTQAVCSVDFLAQY